MRTCPKCQFAIEDTMIFCPHCGLELPTEPAPVSEPIYEAPQPPYQPPYQAPYQPPYQPPYQAPQPPYQQPYQPPYYQPQQPNQPSMAMKIVSMALAIGGFAFACMNALYTLIFLSADPEMALGFAFVMDFFSLPLSLVGFILSLKCRNAGDTSTMTKVGKALGLAGTITSAACFFIAFFAAVAMA